MTLQIFDIFGKTIFTSIVNSQSEFQMKVDQLASGTCILRITDEQGHTASLKRIKD